MHTAFTLAGVSIALETPRPVSVMDNFRPFCGESGEPCVTVRLREMKRLPEPKGSPLFENVSFSVFREGQGFVRRYHDHKEGDRPYALGKIPAGAA